jgi:hypothetical protein
MISKGKILFLISCGCVILYWLSFGETPRTGGSNLGLLFSTRNDSEELLFSTKPGAGYPPAIPFRHIGKNLNIIAIPRSEMLLPTDGEDLQGTPFNLALLRLPADCKWQFIGVARGPQNYRSGENVMGTTKKAMEGSLIG